MPRLSAWAVRAALIYFLAGFTLGGLMLANKGVPFWPQAWLLLPSHIEFLLVGWMVQFAIAVAFWILPRFPGGSRGNEKIAWAAFVLINLGLLLAALQYFSPAFLLISRLCETAAGGLFLLHAWGRVKPLYK